MKIINTQVKILKQILKFNKILNLPITIKENYLLNLNLLVQTRIINNQFSQAIL